MIRNVRRYPSNTKRTRTLLAIDTGLRDLGAAFFEDGKLVDLDLVVNPEGTIRDASAWCAMQAAVAGRFRCPNELAVELMVVRTTRRDVNPDDLIQLVGVAGVLIGHYAASQAVAYRPEQWKGNVKKRIHHPRILRELDADEAARVNDYLVSRGEPIGSIDEYVAACKRCRGNEHPDDLFHNVVDAIGIGLAHLGRIKGVRR